MALQQKGQTVKREDVLKQLAKTAAANNFQIVVGRHIVSKERTLVVFEIVGQAGAFRQQVMLELHQAKSVALNLLEATREKKELSGVVCKHNKPAETCVECNTVTLN